MPPPFITSTPARASAHVPATDEEMGDIDITLAGERFTLLPERLALWGSTLLAADLHLGKCEALHTLGIAAPAALMGECLGRLTVAIERTGASRLLILGDLLHAPAGITPPMVDAVAAWRARCNIDLVVVPGNHDRRLATLGDAWKMSIASEQIEEGPFAFRHDPTPVPGKFVIGGHLHPCIRLPGGRFAMKIPCFHAVRPADATGTLILPAFSTFTAGVPLPRRVGDRVFAIAENRVIEV